MSILHGVITIFEDVIAVGASESVQFPTADRSFQAAGTTDSGAGSATIEVQGSLDNENFDVIGTITLTLGTVSTSDSFASNDRYNYHRGEVTAISGTGATVKLLMGY